MKKIFEDCGVFCLLGFFFYFYLFSPLPESNHNVYLDLLFLALQCFFIIVCLYPRPVGTVGQILLPLGTSAKIIFYNKQELRNIHSVLLTDGARHLLYFEENLLTY